jgi:hypothetical protein
MNDKETFQKYVHGFMGITVITKESPDLPYTRQKLKVHLKVWGRGGGRMLIISFGYCSTIHHEFDLAGQTVNQHYYLVVLRCMRDIMEKKTTENVDCRNIQPPS